MIFLNILPKEMSLSAFMPLASIGMPSRDADGRRHEVGGRLAQTALVA